MFFQDQFNDRSLIEMNMAVLELAKHRLEEVDGEDKSEAIDKAEVDLIMLAEPRLWNVHLPNNVEVEMQNSTEQFLISVSEHLKQDVSNLTVYRFYSIVKYLKEKSKQQKNK